LIEPLTSQRANYTKPWNILGWEAATNDHLVEPHAILHDGNVSIDHCFCFQGFSGQIGIKLNEEVVLSHFNLPYPKAVSPDRLLSAPRHVVLWGLVRDQDHVMTAPLSIPQDPYSTYPDPDLIQYRMRKLAELQYSPHRDLPSNFVIHDRAPVTPVAAVLLEVLNNWGGKETCIYRVRMYPHSI
jgi:hypothetical protein